MNHFDSKNVWILDEKDIVEIEHVLQAMVNMIPMMDKIIILNVQYHIHFQNQRKQFDRFHLEKKYYLFKN